MHVRGATWRRAASLPVALRTFVDSNTQTPWGSVFAMSIVSLAPIFGFFLAGQRYLVRGIATTGLVTFSTPPALGVDVTADFEFDVPVRFDTDHMAVTIETYRLHAWQQIPIVELRT